MSNFIYRDDINALAAYYFKWLFQILFNDKAYVKPTFLLTSFAQFHPSPLEYVIHCSQHFYL